MKIYNGEGQILGRLAAQAAKDALLGEEVKVVNCSKVIISGRKTNTFAREKQRRDRKGYPLKSAKLPRLADRFVRRCIRGMLPWKQNRGREAFKHVLCYSGVPSEFADKELLTVKGAEAKKLPTLKYTTVGAIVEQLGGRE
jgi:large subunit ribosomal protein L13